MSVLAWHGGYPRFHSTANEDFFAFSEALAASNHMSLLIIQLVICYYCNHVIEKSYDGPAKLAADLNPLYKWEALLFVPVTLLWLSSGHQLGIWVLVPSVATRIFWHRKGRQGIDLGAREPLADASFRTLLMMILHGVSSLFVGARLYWPRVQLDISHMDIVSEYSYIGAQGFSSMAFLVIWFYMPTFCWKVCTHLFGAGLDSTHVKDD